MKKMIALLLAVLMVAAMFVGCASNGAEPPATDTKADTTTDTSKNENVAANDTAKDDTAVAMDEKYVIGYALTDLTNSFYINMREAGTVAAEDYGVEVIWKSSEGTLDTQISIVENFIEQGVNCIVIDPIDKEGIIPVIKEAEEAGIPCMTVGNFVDTSNNYNILYNDYADTYRIAEFVAACIDYKGTVGLIYGKTGNFCSDQRQAGFEEAMAQYPDITVISVPGGWDAANGMTAAADMIAAYPELAAIHSVSDDQTYGALQAVETAGLKGKILITSYDGSQEADKLVESGDITVDLLTGAKRVGYYSIQVAVQLCKGEDVPVKNYMASHFVMSEETQAKFTELGLDKDISMVTGAEAYDLFDGYQADFNPEAAAAAK